MDLIPVIDLKEGAVVHAKQGLRELYAPINSPLCNSAKLLDVIAAFLEIARFKIIYLADLNAITDTGNNRTLIHEVLQTHKDICFWIDAGFQNQPWSFEGCNNYLPVLGSESYSDDAIALINNLNKNFILSLDFSARNEKLGAQKLFNDISLLPDKVIIMTLARVGSDLGPDFARLHYYQKLFPRKEIIASGGIRSKEDLEKLKNQGINKALCATALHNKTISRFDIENL